MFQAAFTVDQSLDGSTIRITDSSNYASPDSISNISARTLSITLADGSYLGAASQFNFPISVGATDFIDIPVTKDYALSITMTLTPVSSQTGSVYAINDYFVLLGYSDIKLYDREYRLAASLITCTDEYAAVDYSIIVWKSDAFSRMFNGDQTGSQRYLDKINSIGLNDCTC